MQYSDTSTNQGIIQEIESILFSSDYGKISGSTSLLQTFTRYCNQALDHITTNILECDNRWQYDDTTYTDFPIATGNLVNNQKDYQLAVTHLKILGISVKDSTGNWQKLMQIDPQDYPLIDRDELWKTASVPLYYDIMANSVFLYPAPATAQMTLTAGLKIYYQRPPNYFATTDTTKVPGFPSLFHRLVALWASLFYCQANTITDKASSLTSEIKYIEDQMDSYYSSRNVDSKTRLVPARVMSK